MMIRIQLVLFSLAMLVVPGCLAPVSGEHRAEHARLRTGAGELQRTIEIEVSQGRLVGTIEEGVRRYLGIPYAGAPTGEFRFRRAPAAADWDGIRPAREFAPVCLQTRYSNGRSKLVGEEDCLYLNVWAPDEEISNRPVLVWIHGGGRRVGDGRRDVSDFVQETGSVVVTIQYRLDHLAFFAHEALTREGPKRLASGNYGFEDAIDALRWIQAEVGRFGGDADRITIGGLSGGGTMVCGLMLAPEAAGLFHRAIVQSAGGCWFPTDTIELAEERGRRAAEALGCQETDDVPACLRAQPVERFFEKGNFLEIDFAPGSTEDFAARPIRGGSTGHIVDGSVFPRSWPGAFSIGAFHPVPVMIGVTEHEGRRIYAELLADIGGHTFGAEDYVKALHGLMGTRELAEQVAADFPLDQSGVSPAEAFADIGTVAHYTCPHAELAHTVASFTPTWLYEFRVHGSRENPAFELGAYHGADTEMLFGYGFSGPITPLDVNQQRAARTLQHYVANFMRTGDPNGDSLPAWPRHGPRDGGRHLEFDEAPHAAEGLRESACRYWRDANWQMLPDL